ncbi:unnamed protein product [Echinostoma caproni]|uniref:Relaxasome subunit MobC n=1 Tax=Echinostoma caproni TaxID=27848 RepID=A0A183BEX7_9TREM|nr:unnamed protein product [Echinostoma caproni]
MSDRRAELEQKKAKLLAIRESKKKRDESRKLFSDEKLSDISHNSSAADLRQTTDELLKDLGIATGDEVSGNLPDQAIYENGLSE